MEEFTSWLASTSSSTRRYAHGEPLCSDSTRDRRQRHQIYCQMLDKLNDMKWPGAHEPLLSVETSAVYHTFPYVYILESQRILITMEFATNPRDHNTCCSKNWSNATPLPQPRSACRRGARGSPPRPGASTSSCTTLTATKCDHGARLFGRAGDGARRARDGRARRVHAAEAPRGRHHARNPRRRGREREPDSFRPRRPARSAAGSAIVILCHTLYVFGCKESRALKARKKSFSLPFSEKNKMSN